MRVGENTTKRSPTVLVLCTVIDLTLRISWKPSSIEASFYKGPAGAAKIFLFYPYFSSAVFSCKKFIKLCLRSCALTTCWCKLVFSWFFCSISFLSHHFPNRRRKTKCLSRKVTATLELTWVTTIELQATHNTYKNK